MKNLITIGCAVLLLMVFLQSNSFAQKTQKAKDVILFEVSKYLNPGGIRRGSQRTLFIYRSGRIACKSLSYNPLGKKVETTNNNCFQISKKKIDELTELAEQTDFLEAEDSYQFFGGGVDYGKTFSIIFYRESGEKEIFLTNPRRSPNDNSLPESVAKFIEKIAEIDKMMEVKYELGEE